MFNEKMKKKKTLAILIVLATFLKRRLKGTIRFTEGELKDYKAQLATIDKHIYAIEQHRKSIESKN